MIVVIGSVAQNWHKQTRTPSDLDIVASYDDARMFIKALGKVERIKEDLPTEAGKKIVVKTDKRIVEIEVAWPLSSGEGLIKLVADGRSVDTIEIAGVTLTIPCLDVLYMVKSSHKYKKNSIHFLKTLTDIHMMRDMGASIPSDCMEWFKQREKETYVNTLPKLNVAKKDFFQGDGIIYEYCHDSLHEAIAFGDRPAYLEYAGGEVWSDMVKFQTLPERIKLLGVLEEACVLAAERSQLGHFDPMPTERWSFEFALSKVCSSVTSGIFRSYAHDNYFKVVAMYDDFGHTYMQKVRAGIANGTVKRLTIKEAA